MSKSVIVVTCPEMGWDCVMGVFTGKEALLDSWLNQELEPPLATFKELEDELKEQYVLHYEELNDYPVAQEKI